MFRCSGCDVYVVILHPPDRNLVQSEIRQESCHYFPVRLPTARVGQARHGEPNSFLLTELELFSQHGGMARVHCVFVSVSKSVNTPPTHISVKHCHFAMALRLASTHAIRNSRMLSERVLRAWVCYAIFVVLG